MSLWKNLRWQENELLRVLLVREKILLAFGSFSDLKNLLHLVRPQSQVLNI